MARVDLQNAEGGVNGRKIDLSVVDDQTNPTLTATAVQGAVSDGALGIVANSPFFFERRSMPSKPVFRSRATPLTGPNGVSSPIRTCSTRSGEARTRRNP